MSRTAGEIVRVLTDCGGVGRESILTLLAAVNRELGSVSDEAVREIAAACGASLAEVLGVATFYSFLSREPRGAHIIRLCETVSCAIKGAPDILSAIEEELGIRAGETTPDGRITLETTSCLGLCDQSPAMLIDDVPHSRLTADGARAIVRTLLQGGCA